MEKNRNDLDVLNYQPSRYNPIDTISEGYATNGVTEIVEEKSTNELVNEQLSKGNFENIPPIMQIAYGLEQLQKATEAKQAKRRAEKQAKANSEK